MPLGPYGYEPEPMEEPEPERDEVRKPITVQGVGCLLLTLAALGALAAFWQQSGFRAPGVPGPEPSETQQK